MPATWSKKENESADVARSSAAAIVHNGTLLRSIENGKTEHAVMLLKSTLTVQAMLLEGSLNELPASRRHTNLVRILEGTKNRK